MNKAFFFDRDGVINYRIVSDYVKTIEELHIFEEVFDVLRQIKALGFKLILITNQQGIGKGLYSNSDLEKVHNYMQEQIKSKTGINFDWIEYCPNLDSESSYRRKPNPGMILDAAKAMDIDLNNSWMVGDSEKDTIAGKLANCKTIYINNKAKPDSADFAFINLTSMLEYLKVQNLI